MSTTTIIPSAEHGLHEPPQLLPVSSPSMHPRTCTADPAACEAARVPAWPLSTVRLATSPTTEPAAESLVFVAVTRMISSSMRM